MPDSTEKKRILIVDDECIIADTLARIFVMEGYEARAVYSAEAALILFPDWLPHLSLIDVRLPGMNGIDLAIQVRATYPQCKISIFAGQAATNDLASPAREHGHTFEVLEKPVHPSTLLRHTARILGMDEQG